MEDKVFGSVLSVLNEYRYCPLCKHPNSLHRGASTDQVVYNDQALIIKSSDYTITIDFYTDNISIDHFEDNRMFDHSHLTHGTRYAPKYQIIDNGILLLGMNLECGNEKCTKYCYTLSFDLDLTARKFVRASLNAEWVCVEDGPDVFEIRNSHSMGITKYSHHLSDGSTKSIEVPLIPINSLNPKETLERLKKLIIFT